MKTYIIGVHNGFDVDDYYIKASSREEAYEIGKQIAVEQGGTLYTIVG